MSESAAMSDPFSYFLSKFREIWRDNKDARCIVECHAGQAWISFHHCLPCPPPSSPPTPPHRQRRPNPSRIRRRLRRANARAVAAQATLDCVQRVEDDGTVLAGQTDKSVQTAVPSTVDKTVQANIQQEAQQAPAPGKASPDEPPYHCTAVQARHDHAGNQQHQVRQQDHHQAVIHVKTSQNYLPQNVFHDSMSSNHRIPQVDGNISPDMSQQCNMCQKELLTMDDYKWHFETKHGREDCRILRSMLT